MKPSTLTLRLRLSKPNSTSGVLSSTTPYDIKGYLQF